MLSSIGENDGRGSIFVAVLTLQREHWVEFPVRHDGSKRGRLSGVWHGKRRVV